MNWIQFPALLFAVAYGLMIFLFYLGWKRAVGHYTSIEKTTQNPSVSIIIAFRNEEPQLPELLNSLASIRYPSANLEIILCNDHSEDNGREIIQKKISCYPCQLTLLDLPEGQTGKKTALQYAAKRAEGEILLFTDADCTFQQNWVQSMVASFSNDDTQMVQGPVLIESGSNPLSRLEQIEFLSLMMTSAGSAGWRIPVLSSAANLAVRKSAYPIEKVQLKSHIHTGDDMFLLEFIKRSYPKGVSFLTNHEAIIKTKAAPDFDAIWNQRKRWSSKSLNYSDPAIISVAVVVFMTNLSIVICSLAAIVQPNFLFWAIGLLVGKTITELPLMTAGFHFYKISHGLFWFLVTQLLYPWYIVTTAMAGIPGNFSWKNRSRHGS